ncbi:MAG: flagellin [Asticcacaulis sp.]
MRVSTGQMWDTALFNLLQAQSRHADINKQIGTEKIATDIGGYGRQSETIANYQASAKSIDNYVGLAKSVGDRLDIQNLALEQSGEALLSARDSLMDALATDNLDNLMSTLETHYMAFAGGLNTQYQGQYLFGGGQDLNAPLAFGTMASLEVPAVADTFVNGSVKKVSKIDPTTSLQTGMLASDLGNEGVELFRQLKEFSEANGGLSGQMDDTTRTFIQNLTTSFTKAYDNMVQATALNGSYQAKVETTLTTLDNQSLTLNGLIADKTSVDMAEAYVRLEQAELSIQASAQIVANLKSTSLLDLLS